MKQSITNSKCLKSFILKFFKKRDKKSLLNFVKILIAKMRVKFYQKIL